MTPYVTATLACGLALLVWPSSTVRTRLVVVNNVIPAATQHAFDDVAVSPKPKQWVALFTALASGSCCALVVGGITGLLCGLPFGLAGAWIVRWLLATASTRQRVDQLQLAAGWDLLAACLRVGLPVPIAVAAVAAEVPQPARETLRHVSELLALGADPSQAWEPALRCTATTRLARAARRTAHSGAALAKAALELAAEARNAQRHNTQACAQRVGVLITGPLGLCFLPAFICLGVLPVIAGLAKQIMEVW